MVSVLDLIIPSLLRERYLFTCSPMTIIMWPFWIFNVAVLVCGRFGRHSFFYHRETPCCRRVSVCPSVCLSVTSRYCTKNDQTDRAGFGLDLLLTYCKLCYKEIRLLPKIRVFPTGTLPKIHAAASQRCGEQNSSTVELVDYSYDGRARRGWTNKVDYTLVYCITYH